MKTNQLLATVLFGALVLISGPSLAHESPARHGGVVRSSGDLQFELVAKGDSAIIHVDDHGKPLSTTGMKGTITVLQGTEKTEAPLQPAGDNRLEAKGVKLGKGAKAIAAIAIGTKTVTVRFAVK